MEEKVLLAIPTDRGGYSMGEETKERMTLSIFLPPKTGDSTWKTKFPERCYKNHIMLISVSEAIFKMAILRYNQDLVLDYVGTTDGRPQLHSVYLPKHRPWLTCTPLLYLLTSTC